MKKTTKLDVDDWEKFLEVGDYVWYRHRKWKVVARYPDVSPWDAPTFLFMRRNWLGKKIYTMW